MVNSLHPAIDSEDPGSITRVRQCLDAALDPVRLEIDDESAHHLGHAGAASGGGHYTVTIVSERFRGRAMIARSSIMATARRL
ncbi:MAG: BolA/IbaG family iron-sulfur metabolism protein [Chromatiales bacterium]